MSTTASAKWRLIASWDSEDADESVAPDRNQNQNKDDVSFAASATRRVYAKTLTITAASSVLDIDLTNLTDVHNQAFQFTTIEALKIKNNNTTSGEKLLVGGAGSGNNAWGAPFNDDQDAVEILGPGDVWARTSKTDPLAVSGSSKTLRFDNFNTTNDMTVNVILIGTGTAL